MVRVAKTRLTPDEVCSLATAIAVTDGMIVLSDRVADLSSEGLRILERSLQLAGGRAEAVDLMDADLPELVVSRHADRTIVAAFNFSEQPCQREIDLAPLGLTIDGQSVHEWWTGATVPVIDGRARLGVVPKHGCRVLVLPENRPA
jgi:hypothetical protein